MVHCPQPPHNFILFDFDVKFPLLHLLLFLGDLKSNITIAKLKEQ